MKWSDDHIIHNVDNSTEIAPCGTEINNNKGHGWTTISDPIKAYDHLVYGFENKSLCNECWGFVEICKIE